jgi:hypothetical protein
MKPAPLKTALLADNLAKEHNPFFYLIWSGIKFFDPLHE